MDFGIGLLDQRYPELINLPASTENKIFVSIVFLVTRKSIINNDISPTIVFEEPEYVHTVFSEVMEHGWVNT